MMDEPTQPGLSPEERERIRYLEYFQKTLVHEGTQDFLAEQKRWFELNRSRLASEFAALAEAQGKVVPALDNPFLTHQDQTEHDSVFTRQIFSPILSKALQVSAKLGYPIRRPVVLANAPSVVVTPAGLPSSDSHMLFIGQGTFSFCNYWAKVFASIFYRAGIVSKEGACGDAVLTAISADSAMLQAVRLVLRYVRSESLVGFGEFSQEKHLFHLRMLLVTATETFVVGHELAHFFLQEQYPELNGIPPGKTLREVELICDAIGFAICSAVGELDDNEASKNLIGPLLLLYALKLSEDAQEILLGITPPISDTHPGLTERIRSLFGFARTVDPTGSLNCSLEEALNYAVIVGGYVKSALQQVKADSSDN